MSSAVANKIITPVLSRHSTVRWLNTEAVGRNLRLNIAPILQAQKKKPLAVIFSWLVAKEKHISRYRALYLSRGFDVLTVDMSVKDFLFPVSGSQSVATGVLDYLLEHVQYEKVLVHAFSVGGYMMGEMFIKMRDNEEKYGKIASRFAGVVTDSAVDFEGLKGGVARAASRNPIAVKAFEWYISTHLAVMYNVATKHYMRSSSNFHNTPLRCPALMFVSAVDEIGSVRSNAAVAENWKKRGVDVRTKCFAESKHVCHLHKYEKEYLEELDNFLLKSKILPAD